MTERRGNFRDRVLIGGRVTIDVNQARNEVRVRNFSTGGAAIDVHHGVPLAPEIELEVPSRNLMCPAKVVWRRGDRAGLAFSVPEPDAPEGYLTLRAQLRTAERKTRQLKRKLDGPDY